MAYALIQNDAVTTYPYSFSQLRSDNPQISFPRTPGPWMEGYGVFEVAPTAKPAYDLNFDIVEGTPVKVGNTWTQVWNQVPASAEDIAERTQIASDATERESVKGDTFVQNFVNMTTAQVETYINNNTADITQVRSLLVKMGKMLNIVAKRDLR